MTKRHITDRMRGADKMRGAGWQGAVRRMAAIAALVIFAIAQSGCANENYEDELAYRTVGIDAMEEGDYESAVAAFNSALSLSGGKITDTELDICYYKAAALFALERYDEAEEVYSSLIDFDKKNADAYYLRGCLYLQRGEGDSAMTDYAAAVQYDSSDYELYIHIYENLAAHAMETEGEEYLQKAFSIKGDSAEQLAARGQIYYLLGEYDNAQVELIAAIGKGSVEANLAMAQVCEAQGDVETAESYYQTYVQSQSADSTAMNALAEIEMGRGNYAQALDYISQGLAMETVPNRRALLSNEIVACEQLADFAGAWEAVQEYVALYPDDLDAAREYVFLKYRQDDTDAADEADAAESIEDDSTESVQGEE